MKELACYIHIPFCKHKCIYCDFYSVINFKNIDQYFTSLLKEIDYYSEKLSSEYTIKTIFFGGGTPSILPSNKIKYIINKLKKKFFVDELAEITLEANPGTLTFNKLTKLKETGVNRLSIGVQSFNNNDLKYLTRIHTSKQAVEIINSAHKAGFNNISLDLIFNLPKQTKEYWLKNLDIATSLPINHISCYSLIVEPGTILNKQVLDGKIKINDDDIDADLYEITINYLKEKGFEQYEVSNFAKKRFQSLHNKFYWEYNEYLGLGPSAHSFINYKRWWNYTSLSYYMSAIQKNNHARMSTENLTALQ
ncbi:MAG TPA: radical SAM family heme chaperone HemW, partial [Melioribacteraceae bacterium]|nr:radical SAM family heme chaperone HemW [Melioribacteraceae bacterium]